jgi:hypothetical protein
MLLFHQGYTKLIILQTDSKMLHPPKALISFLGGAGRGFRGFRLHAVLLPPAAAEFSGNTASPPQQTANL